jgi:amino acid transporter
MDYNERKKKISEVNAENFIWVIYIGIIIASWYANSLEKKYFLSNDLKSKEKYRDILIGIFIVLIIIYLIFLKSAYEDLKNLKPDDTDKKKKLLTLSFFASLLIAISGFIYLYIAYEDENIDVELAFN